jgi:hypothetical protein
MTDNIFTHAAISDLRIHADGSSTFTLSKPGEVETFTVTTPPNIENVREWLNAQGEKLKERHFQEDMTARDEAAKLIDDCAFALINLHQHSVGCFGGAMDIGWWRIYPFVG